MTHDWLLVETLGDEPAVVADGVRTKNLIPVATYLRRHPHLMPIQTAIGETVRAKGPLSSLTPKNDRVICTEVVQMTDGYIHGVQLWVGSPSETPPPRPEVGPQIWDLAAGVAIDTPESLRIIGWDPHAPAHGRPFAGGLSTRHVTRREADTLSMIINPEEGRAICDTWEVNDYRGERITVGFVTRFVPELLPDGAQHVICRGMSWRSVRESPTIQEDLLAQRILNSLAEPGVYRALVDPRHWTLLKWLGDPLPFIDWRAQIVGERAFHPDDLPTVQALTAQFGLAPVSGVLRMVAPDGGWVAAHMTVQSVELDTGIYAALVSWRLPTPDELAAAGIAGRESLNPRKSRSRKEKSAKH
ncbi:PAS domain-containing protein [Mycolicibacterium sp.]|uniref:PAS domain-containing protein n=1 Tax=Mycolicibacterium sp. TaxID=2320850 RepID=UPI003D1414B3